MINCRTEISMENPREKHFNLHPNQFLPQFPISHFSSAAFGVNSKSDLFLTGDVFMLRVCRKESYGVVLNLGMIEGN